MSSTATTRVDIERVWNDFKANFTERSFTGPLEVELLHCNQNQMHLDSGNDSVLALKSTSTSRGSRCQWEIQLLITVV